MNAFATAVKFFQDCGLFIYPSVLIMALGLTIAVERFIYLHRARSDNRQLWDKVLPLLQKSQFKDVYSLASQSDAAMGKLVANGLSRLQSSRKREDIDAAMEEGMMEIVPRLEKRTHYIATFANVITLVGLLGTIMGLIKAFTAVAQVNPAEKAELLSASISIAMYNTAFALMVAIPFLLVHAFLQA
ncbi:MAG: MotA/TolQ/ExbB proton channel family protein, partial [Vitreoscilla sp.]|nr:MotA/TolQ/ExbB proton channel family protein [Vitreoscilla sp.]